MSDIPVSIVTNVVQRLVDKAIQETSILCCFSCIATEYENEKNDLEAKLKSVKEVAEVAKSNAKEILSDVKTWMEKADNLIKEDIETKKRCFFGLFPNCIGYYRRGKELQRKLQDIKKLIENFRLENISRSVESPGMEYYSSQDFIPLESRELVHTQLKKELQDGNKYMIGLQGMGGSGKTRLAKEVGKEIQQSKIFDKVIFVVISNPPNVRKIQDDIASALDLSLNGNEQERREKLWSRIRNEKKILIILDDVWEKLNFEDIGIPYRDNHEGCCILLTTRDLKVCHSMGCQRTIQLQLLPEKEAWFMFQKFAGISDNSSPALKDVAFKIASECKGLPIAIITMASTLKVEYRVDYWESILTILESPRPILDIEEDLIHVYNCLRVSYDNLKSDNTKYLFLLCSMFPEDHEIPIEELIRYGIGLGLFGELESYKTARSQVRLRKDKLIDSCLLLKAENDGCVKMHDLVRDVAHWIANDEIHETTERKRTLKALQEDSVLKESKVRYLYCHNINDLSYQLNLPHLEILILACKNYPVSISIPDTFFHGLKGIRVLTVKEEYNWGTSIELRPTSIQVLKNLRSLDLRYCNLGDISVFGSLQKIETLELHHCSINELPNGIVELKKLRLFRLQSCEINESPYKVIGRFSEIEELYVMGNKISNGSVDRAVVSDLFDENRISPALERYHIEIGVDIQEIPVDICALNKYLNESTSRALSIGHFDASISNAKMKDMMQRAEILCLYKLEGGRKSISPDFAKAFGGAMIELIKLGLYDCSEIECLIDATKLSSSLGTVFSNLVTLRVRKMDNLKELCHGSTPSDFLQKLEDLSVYDCPKRTYLFPGSITQSLVLLKKLTIEHCDAMEYIIKEESEGTMNADHDDGSALGSNERKISDSAVPSIDPSKDIRGCGQLECFLSVCSNKRQTLDSTPSSTDLATINCSQLQNTGLFVGNFNLKTLQKLWVEFCPKLTYLFTVTVAQSLVLLEDLTIGFCDAMKCIIKDESGETVNADQRSSLVSMFPKLQSMNILRCGQLECFLSVGSNKRQTLDSTTSSPDLVSQDSNLFNNVRHMRLVKCSQVKWVFTLSNAATMQLEELFIYGCDGLKHIITDVGVDNDQMSSSYTLQKLRHVSIFKCKQLEYVFGEYSRNHTPNVKIDIHAPALEGLNLESLSNMISICSTRYYLKCPSLKIYWFEYCPQFAITSTADFMMHSDAGHLEKLTIKGLEASNLEWLAAFGTAQCLLKQSLSNVKAIHLQDCPKLILAFTISNATTMPLEELHIIKCNGLKHIITVGGDINDHRNNNYTLQKLKSVFISDCKQLESVFGEYHHEDNSSYQNHTSNLEIYIHLPALERFKLDNLPNMTSVCTKKYHATCSSLKKFDHKGCPQFAKTSIIDFIEHSDARELKCNEIDSKELVKRYKEELQLEEEKLSHNVLSKATESKETKQEVIQRGSELEEQATGTSSTGSELTSIEDAVKQSAQEIPVSDLEQRNSQDLLLDRSMNEPVPTDQQQAHGETTITSEISITDVPHDDSNADTLKQSVREEAISEKSKVATSSTNYGPRILLPGSQVIPIQNGSSQELMEHEEVDFHSLFKIDSRRALLLNEAFAKYPHLRDWQNNIPSRFCKWGYKSLSDMLVFLKEKTPKAMDELCKKKFENLYAELVLFGFDKGWLASIHQRVIDLQVGNEKLKHLVELESKLNNARAEKLKHLVELEVELNNLSAEMARIKDDLSKYETVFDF